MKALLLIVAFFGAFAFVGAIGHVLGVYENGEPIFDPFTMTMIFVGMIGFFVAKVSLKKFNTPK